MIDTFTGKLLVASSTVTDPMYAGGVCLIVHHDEENLIGVMLNRPLKPTPEALMAMLGEEPDSNPAEPSGEPSESKQIKNRLAAVPPSTPDLASQNPWRMLHFGGPLSGPVVAIHPMSQYGEVETGQGIYVAAQKQHLESLVRQQEGPCRLIVGHLGWQTEQLMTEIDQGIWHVVPATTQTVFSPAQEMWPRIIRRATTGSLAKWIGVNDVPQASELN